MGGGRLSLYIYYYMAFRLSIIFKYYRKNAIVIRSTQLFDKMFDYLNQYKLTRLNNCITSIWYNIQLSELIKINEDRYIETSIRNIW